MKNFINHIFQIQFQQFLRLSFMVTCQSSELDWEVTVELSADFLSLGRGSVIASLSGASGSLRLKKTLMINWRGIRHV